MNKLFPLILTITLSLTLAACGKEAPRAVNTPTETPMTSNVPALESNAATGVVEYSLISSKKKVAANEEFTVDVLMNTKDETIISGQVYLNIDEKSFDVVDIDIKNSDFSIWLDKTHLDNVRLTFGEGAGIKKTDAKVATLKLKALANGNADVSFDTTQTIASNAEGKNVLNTKQLESITVNVVN